MSKAAYQFPPDEFDAPPDPDSPRGVHRAPRSAWSRWWPFLAVLVIVPALAWGAVTYLADRGRLPDLPGGTPSSSATVTPPTTPGEDPTAAETAPPPTVETTPTEAPPNLATPVSVLNGARINGLAGRIADQLAAAGFTAVTAGNHTADIPVASTIYYGSEDLRATADLVAQTIDVTAVVLSPVDAPGGVTVVLKSDPGA